MVKLAELAQRFNGEIRGNFNVEIRGVATLDRAGARDIAYVASKEYYEALARTAAGAVILRAGDAKQYAGTALVVDNPRLCFAMVATLLNPHKSFQPGVHPTAFVDKQANVASSAWIGPHSVVEAGAVVESNVFVGPGCYIGERAVVGEHTRLAVRVVLNHDCIIGKSCMVHPGVVIGGDGFGYVRNEEQWVKIPQLGRVRIGDNVEIGANTAIDRGALDDTIIGDGVKLDNLIQIGHNVSIGEHTAIAGCVGIAGSTHVGKRCAVGGQVTFADHLEIADDVQIAIGSSVTRSITKSGTYSSSLKAEPATKWNRSIIRLLQLDGMAKRLKVLEQEVRRLSGASKT
ncbi:MAG: UDP-3-O-(3-hydroxymyristoyl)glucosamine N-acyltransferase [Acidiferrobacterales bacterium]